MSTEPETNPIPLIDQATIDRWNAEAARQVEEDKRKLKAIVALLREHKAASVGVTYSGSDDSGCLDSVHVYAQTFDENTLYDVEYTEVDEATEQAVGEQFLDDLAWQLLELIVPAGYEINEGGQGTIVLNVVSGQILNNHGTNCTEYNSKEMSLEGDDDADVQD